MNRSKIPPANSFVMNRSEKPAGGGRSASTSLPHCSLSAIVLTCKGDFMSVNKVILVGRLGPDPETRYTGGGQAVANFSVATDETYKDRNGARHKRTHWHLITGLRNEAQIAQ